MILENQVCSFELAKKLKEVGVLQGTYWIWREEKMYHENLPVLITVAQMPTGVDIHAFNLYSAFTVAELGVMMKGISIMPEWKRDWDKTKTDFAYITCTGPNEVFANAPTEAEARAQLLIYLIENDNIDLQEVNKRLLQS